MFQIGDSVKENKKYCTGASFIIGVIQFQDKETEAICTDYIMRYNDKYGRDDDYNYRAWDLYSSKTILLEKRFNFNS